MPNSPHKSTIRRPLPEKTHLDNDAYGVSRVLGQGSFGITYFGGDLNLHRYVAIKEFFPDGCVRQRKAVQPSIGMSSLDFQTGKKKFLHEARALARFHHPNIVQVLSIFEDNNTAYMVLEFLKGKTLMQVLEERKSIPEQEAIEYTQQIGEALIAVHNAGMLHLDIKPENIILCDDGRVVLIDFGLNKKRENVIDNTTRQLTNATRLGSESYAPPEQHLGNLPMDASTDIYALGAALYHLLTGSAPVSAPQRAMGNDLLAPHRVNPKITPTISNAVMRAMQLKVDQRPQSAKEFINLLTPKPASSANATDSTKVLSTPNAINPTAVLAPPGKQGITGTTILPNPPSPPASNHLPPPVTVTKSDNKNTVIAVCIATFMSLWVISALVYDAVRTPSDPPSHTDQSQPASPANSPDNDTAPTSDNPLDDLTVTNLSDTAGPMGGSQLGSITGTITNNSDHSFNYLQVEINLYDSSGSQIGSSIDNISNLEPHRSWNFSAIITVKHVDSYKIVKINGW